MDCKDRNIAMWLYRGIGLFMVGTLCGCIVNPPVAQQLAFFPSEIEDRVLFQNLETQINPSLETCRQQNNCDEVYFINGLLALFKDRNAAAASFREVLKTAPAGPLATSSTHWLRLLSEVPVAHDAAFAENTKTMVQLLVTRMRTQSALACYPTVEAPQNRRLLVQGLQRSIRARDRQIAELTDQLRALKQIDLDGNVNRKLAPSLKIQTEK